MLKKELEVPNLKSMTAFIIIIIIIIAANMLNKQSRTADKGWPSSLGAGRGAINSSP
jgi:hypothetical protein